MTDRWLPMSEADLETALADGRLDEGPHLDFKRELGAGKSANMELGRDLAMFANDGGALIIGVAEPTAGRFERSPVPLAGLTERIAQVASRRLDPPLNVDISTIRSTDPDRGYVVVRVPASASAPHMTDDRYWGRIGSTRSPLSDAQVRAVIERRQAAVRPILSELDEDVARDPIPKESRRHAHLHVLARPRFSEEDLVLREVERAGNWPTWIYRELLKFAFDPRRGTWSPDLENQAGEVGRRARGSALHSHYMEQDRSASQLLDDPDKLVRYEDDLLDLELDEDGALHLYCCRGSDTSRSSSSSSDGGEVEVVIPVLVAGLVMRVVQIAARITELTGFVGDWDFAMAVTGLQGATPHTSGWDAGPAYSRDEYRRAVSADTIQLVSNPRTVADQLVGGLLRGLGQDGGVDRLFPPAQS